MIFTIGSLFDGSGGFPLAASLYGGIPIWTSEILIMQPIIKEHFY